MTKLLRALLALPALTLVVVLGSGPASAGGWAVATLDSVPVAVTGQTVTIGFTVRAHGIRPVEPSPGVGIVLQSDDGRRELFPAEASGPVGHYVVDVTFPDDGAWTWAVHHNWGSDQDLGPLDLVSSSGASALARPSSPPPASTSPSANPLATGPAGPSDHHRWPAAVRYGLALLALGLASWSVRDLVPAGRRLVAA